MQVKMSHICPPVNCKYNNEYKININMQMVTVKLYNIVSCKTRLEYLYQRPFFRKKNNRY